MEKKLAFVLSGGGSRGAMQAGALRALLEAGCQPDLATGSSIGAANAAFLAVHGFNLSGVHKLEEAWKTTVDKDLLPANLWWQLMRAVFRRPDPHAEQRIRDFATTVGLTPDLRFMDIQGIRLYLVAADLNAGCPVIFGLDPQESVLEGVLASVTLPPWFSPRVKDDRYLVDGSAVSNLPIEAALHQGATEIIALDLFDPNELDTSARGLRPFLLRLDKTVENRQTELEMKLASARGVPVQRIHLIGENPVPIWDFRHSPELIERGYRLAQQAMQTWQGS